MSPSTISQPFRVASLDNLVIGQSIKPLANGSNGPTMTSSSDWSLPAGLYTVRQVVEGLAPLLEAVVHQLGPDPPEDPPARDMLLDSLASNLNIGTRESALSISTSDLGRKEVADQAVKIGKKLVEYASETREVQYVNDYAIRSPCEGHLLKPDVARLMFGPRSLAHLMQVYNEYLHQMVLLRDALIPFENFEDVMIPIPGKNSRELGLRFTEQTRTSFLAELMTKQLTQYGLFRAATSLVAPELGTSRGIAFQYPQGLVLPSFIAGGNACRLFRYLPATLVDNKDLVAFISEISDYYSAPRSEIAISSEKLEHIPDAQNSWSASPNEAIVRSRVYSEHGSTANDASRFFLKLHMEFADGREMTVDLGQIGRGWRYAYRPSQYPSERAKSTIGRPIHLYSAVDVLTCSGSGLLVSKEGGIHLIPVASSLTSLALLGRIYPENVVILEPHEMLTDAESTGKGLPGASKFVIQHKEAKGIAC